MDQRRDHAVRIDLQIFRRMMLQLFHVDDVAFIAEALLLEAQPHTARWARAPAVVKDHHGLLPNSKSTVGSDARRVVPLFDGFVNAPDDPAACPHESHLIGAACSMSASLIGRSGSSAFRLSTTAMSMSLTGSCFSSESAPGPFHHGIRRRGGTIYTAALPSDERQVQADMRTHLIHGPARDILPPLGGSRFFPIGFDPARFSCCCHGLLPGPPELSTVNPYPVHDHGQPACQGHDRLFHPAAPGDLHGPRLEP